MSVWILHLKLTEEEQEEIAVRTHVPLPFEHLPDLGKVSSQGELRRLLQTLHPDDPPEALTRKLERVWNIYSHIGQEDIIAVPLPHLGEAALAEVTGRYVYQVGGHGVDVHLLPVKWHDKRVPLTHRKLRDIFKPAGAPMIEVSRPEERTAIREHLPHPYNRFVKWRWVMVVFSSSLSSGCI